MGLALLQKAIAGNKDYLKQLMFRESEFIYKLAFIHTKYEDDAKIIMKNTIIYISENIHKVSKFSNFESYIIRATIKHTNEYLEEVGMVDFNTECRAFLDSNGNIDMYKAIDLLEVHLKNVVILLYFYNMSYKEVADILNINESTVKMYLRKSLKIMKESIKGDFLHEE